jgi:heterodisulfide reductase subunit B
MEFGYYPGCALTGSARKLDRGVRTLFKRLGHSLTEIPEWNCCGALEYGDRKELVDLSRENLRKAEGVCSEILAPCPACCRNLKEANSDKKLIIWNPLELLERDAFVSMNARRDLRGLVFTPYYGCVLMRPEETAIKNRNVMEETIAYFGGDIDGEKVRDRCCGGNLFFSNREATEKLSMLVMEKSRGIVVVFCPLCHMALTTFSSGRKIVYLTDVILYLTGDNRSL